MTEMSKRTGTAIENSDQIELDVETGVNGRNGFVRYESIFEEVEENRNPDPTIAEPEIGQIKLQQNVDVEKGANDLVPKESTLEEVKKNGNPDTNLDVISELKSDPKKQQNGEKRVIGNAGFVPEKSVLGNAYENGNTEATDVVMNEMEFDPKQQQNGEKRVIGNAGFIPENVHLGNAYKNGNTEATDVAMNETEIDPKKPQNCEKSLNGNSGFVPEKSILGNVYENGNTEATDVVMNETETSVFFCCFNKTATTKAKETTPQNYDSKICLDQDEIIFDLEGIDQSLECESLTGDKKELLEHPLVETYLDTEWRIIRKYYILNLTIYLIWLCTFTFLIQNHMDWQRQTKNIFFFTYEVPKDYHHKIFICGYLVTILMVFYLTFRELTQLFTLWHRSRPFDYLQLGNLLDWALIITTLIYLITIWEDPNLALNVGLWAMLLGWIFLTTYMSEFPLVGTIIHAIFNVTVSLLSVFVILLPILCGFMLFFNFTLASDNGAVNDIKKTFVKTIAMMLGNIDIGEFDSQEAGIFGFMIFICVIVMNVMLGVTVNRITEILKQANLIRLKKIYNASQGFHKLDKICGGKTKTSFKTVKVPLKPKASNLSYIFSSILRAQGFLGNVKYQEHNAKAYSSKGYKPKDIGIPSWVVEKAKKICENHKEVAKKSQDVTDNATLSIRLENIELTKTVARLQSELDQSNVSSQ